MQDTIVGEAISPVHSGDRHAAQGKNNRARDDKNVIASDSEAISRVPLGERRGPHFIQILAHDDIRQSLRANARHNRRRSNLPSER